MNANDAFALASKLSDRLHGASSAFRTMPDAPQDLEEFYAFYEPDEQRAVIERGRQALREFMAAFEQVKGDPEGEQVFVKELKRSVGRLNASLKAADPGFDPAPVDAALAIVVPRVTRREGPKVAAPGTSEKVTELFGFLASSKAEKALLTEVAAKALDLTKKGGSTEVTFEDAVMTCGPKVKPAASVPASYAGIAKVFGSVLWKSSGPRGGPSVGFCGLDKKGQFNDGSWEWQALEEGDNEALLKALKKAKLGLRDIHCAFACGQNWVLFDPTREAKNGEPALAFVSHGDCEWVPMKSADGHDAPGVLLRLMAWSLVGKRGLYPEISA